MNPDISDSCFQKTYDPDRPEPEIIEIESFDDPRLDIYARLTETQLRSGHRIQDPLFIAESPNVIARALDAGYEPVSMLMERKHIERQAKEIIDRCRNVPVFTAPLNVLTELTGFPLTRGVLCAMKRRALPSVSDICSRAGRITVLENVVNPTNIGAIFRSAAALGIDAVLLTPACCDPLYRRAVRVSMGTVFQIPWTYIGDEVSDWPHPGLDQLREMGFATSAMALTDDSVSIRDPSLNGEKKLAVILGTEGDGLSCSTIADCDYTVKIPMSHGVDSLNVAAASAVAFWELGNNRV